MTVIAFDGKYLAADKQVTWYGSCTATVTKIFKLNDGTYIAFSGSGDGSSRLLEWFNSERNPEKYPKFEGENTASAFQVANGKIRLWGTSATFYEVEDKIFASGAGQDYAEAAMYLGKNAIEAVQVAIDLSASCGKGIDYFDVTI